MLKSFGLEMSKRNFLKVLRDFNFQYVFGKSFWQQRSNNQRRKFFRGTFLQSKEKDADDEESNKETESQPETPIKTISASAAKPAEVPEIFKTLNIEKDGQSAVFSIRKNFIPHNLDFVPESDIEISRFDAADMYRKMQVIRNLERSAGSMYAEKIIRGFCHLYMGEEAIAVGMTSMLRPPDNVITAYRCHGWCYVTGTSVVEILSELAGRKSGVQRGKGGSMHMYNSRFYGGNGIVGAQIPLGAGIALSSQYKGDGGVCIMCYGDGAANQGQVFEAYNMACLLKLPAIFVCENNQYGMGTSAKRSSCCDLYYTRGDYIPGLWVNAMDIVAVRSATKFAIDYVIENGPIVLEMSTYRYQGHSMSDPGTTYRPRSEVEEVRKTSDPIQTFKKRILERELLTEEQFELIDKDAKKEVDDATELAKKDVEIDLSELCADVYANNLEPKTRGIIDWNLTHKQLNKGKNNP